MVIGALIMTLFILLKEVVMLQPCRHNKILNFCITRVSNFYAFLDVVTILIVVIGFIKMDRSIIEESM